MINNTLPPVKPNDWFVLNALYPKATTEDFKTMAVTTENTDLKPKEFYRDQPSVKKIFQDKNKEFDEMAFNTYYDGLVETYNQFAQEPYEVKDFTQTVVYSPYNYLAPLQSKKETYDVKISKIFNPGQQQIGIVNPELWSASEFSEREIAQTQKAKSLDGKDLGFTPNDKSKSGIIDFFYDRIFGTKDILVLAQWDEDGVHIDPFTNEEVSHKKGERKYNEYGKPYYETLSGRNPVDKIVLSPWDTITTDGSWQNKLDFMDSDSKEKTIVGTLLKSAARITPYFIPGIGQYYALATIGLTAMEFLPQIGTMVGKFISGEDFKTTDLYRSFNYWQGLGQSLSSPTVSDHSMSNIWTWENLFTLVPEIFIQLKQQRVLGNLPKKLKTTSADAKQLKHIQDNAGPEKLAKVKSAWREAEKLQDYSEAQFQKHLALLQSGDPEVFELYKHWVNFENKLAKGLAVGYMTGASTTEVDQVIEQFDVQGRDAAWMKLGVLSAFWFSMNYFSFGDWAVQYSLGMDDAAKMLKKTVMDKATALKQMHQAIDERIVQKSTAKVGEKISRWNQVKSMADSEFFKKGWTTGKEIFEKFYSSGITGSMMKESLEEISEESFTDQAKHIYNLFYTLNLTQNKDIKINWEDDETLSRYAMAGIGGALGGALFHANNSVLSPLRKEAMNADFSNVVVDMVRNNQSKELYDHIERIRNSKQGFASKNLSFSVYNKSVLDDGSLKIKFEPVSEKALSQNDVIANTLKLQVELVEKAIFEGKVPSDQQIQDVFSQRTGSLLEVGMHTAIEDDLKKYTSEYIELYDKLNTLSNSETNNPQDEQRIKDLYLELQTKQKQIENLSSEEQIGEYYAEAMFNLDKVLNNSYAQKILDEEDGAKALYGKNYDSLNEEQRIRVDSYIASDNSREKLRLKKKLFDAQEKMLSSSIDGVQEYFASRKNLTPILNKIDFDYTWDEDNVDTQISNLVPQFSKKGISEYLKLDQIILKTTDAENPDLIKALEFMVFLEQLMETYTQDPSSLSDDEYALLKFLHKQVPNTQTLSLDELGIDHQEYLDFLRQDSKIREFENEIHLIGEEDIDWTAHHTLNQIETSLINSDESKYLFDYDTGYGFVYLNQERIYVDYLLSKGSAYSDLLKRTYDIHTTLKGMNLQPEQKSALDKLIMKFDIQYKSNTKTILDLIEQERNRLLDKPLEEYVNASVVTAKELDRQLEQLSRMATIIYSHMNFSTTPGTQIGYFQALNEYNAKNGIKEEYAVFDASQGEMLLRYIDVLMSRLEYLKSLSDFNQRSKIPNKEKSELRMMILQYRDLLRVLSNVNFPDQEMTFKEYIEKTQPDVYDEFFQLETDPKTINDKLDEISSKENVSVSSEIERVFDKVLQTEHLVHTQFSKLDQTQKQIVVESLLEQFDSNAILKTVIDEQFTVYNKDSKSINELDRFFYLASVLVGDSYKFLQDYNDLLTKESTPFGLFGDQQQQLRLTHMLSQGVFNQNFGQDPAFKLSDLMTLFRAKFRNLPYLMEEINHLDNMIFIYGIQGTGKTTAVLDFMSRVFAKRGLASVALAPQPNISEKVLNIVVQNKITNIEDQNLDSLFSLLFGAENYIKLNEQLTQPDSGLFTLVNTQIADSMVTGLQINLSNPIITAIIKELTERQKYTLKLGQDPVHAILIDESTQISNVKMILLNKFIEIYNSKQDHKLIAITTGDWRQVSSEQTITSQDGLQTFTSSSQQLLGIRQIDLNSSIRTANNVKEFNSSQLSHLAEIQATKYNYESSITITLKHGEQAGLPYGEFSVDYTELGFSYAELVNQLLEKGVSVKEIALIGESSNTQMRALAAEKGISFISKDSVNGVEFDYVIADLDLKSATDFSRYTKYLNTVLTRSRKATYINNTQLSKYSGLISFQKETEIFDTPIPPERILDYKNRRITMINNLAKKLIGATELTVIPEYIKPKDKQSDASTNRFNQDENAQPVVATKSDLQELFVSQDQDGTPTSILSQEVDNPLFLQTYVRHDFGLAEDDGTGRAIFSPKNRLRNINLIRSRAKSIFIKNLYAKDPKSIHEQKQELIDHINREVVATNPVVDFDLVLYNRPRIKDDSFIGKSYEDLLVYSIRMKMSDGSKLYLPMAVQGKKLIEHVVSSRTEDYEAGTDIVLNPDKIIQFLSPNTNSYLFYETQTINGKTTPTKKDYISVKELKSQGYVVSPVYVIHHSFKSDATTKQYNGKEFVLVSQDPSLTPDQLFDIFESELNQAENNSQIKQTLSKQEIEERMLNGFGLSNSRVKLVFLNRRGFKFYDGTNNDWLSKIKQGRKETNLLTVRSLADSYITSTMFRVLGDHYQTLMKEHTPKGKEFRLEDVPEEHKSFVLFYQELISQLQVLSEYPEGESAILKDIRSREGVNKIVAKIQTNLSKQKTKDSRDALFTQNHLFLFLLDAVMEGGVVKSPLSEQIYKFQTNLSSPEDKIKLKQYLNSVFETSKAFTESITGEYGIWYTAQIAKGNLGERFQYVQNVDDAQLENFNIPPVFPGEIYLTSDRLFEDQAEVTNMPEPGPNVDNSDMTWKEPLKQDIFNIFSEAGIGEQDIAKTMEVYEDTYNNTPKSITVEDFVEIYVRELNTLDIKLNHYSITFVQNESSIEITNKYEVSSKIVKFNEMVTKSTDLSDKDKGELLDLLNRINANQGEISAEMQTFVAEYLIRSDGSIIEDLDEEWTKVTEDTCNADTNIDNDDLPF